MSPRAKTFITCFLNYKHITKYLESPRRGEADCEAGGGSDGGNGPNKASNIGDDV